MRARPIILSSIHKNRSQKKRQTLIASGLALFSFDKLHYVKLLLNYCLLRRFLKIRPPVIAEITTAHIAENPTFSAAVFGNIFSDDFFIVLKTLMTFPSWYFGKSWKVYFRR